MLIFSHTSELVDSCMWMVRGYWATHWNKIFFVFFGRQYFEWRNFYYEVMFYILSYKFKYPIQRSVLYLFALNLGYLFRNSKAITCNTIEISVTVHLHCLLYLSNRDKTCDLHWFNILIRYFSLLIFSFHF